MTDYQTLRVTAGYYKRTVYGINKKTGEFISLQGPPGKGIQLNVTLPSHYFLIERQAIIDSGTREDLECFDFPDNLKKFQIRRLEALAGIK